jgi:ADP-ribose pyrophosphatase YjhB (NUDIX family)
VTGPYERTWPHVALGAQALLRDQRGHIALVKPTYNNRGHYLVGGECELDEDFLDALAREVREETGLHRVAGRLLVSERTAADPTRNKPSGVNQVFDVEPVTPDEWAALTLPADELCDPRLVPLDNIDAWVLPEVARRIRAGVDALATGATIYLPPYKP